MKKQDMKILKKGRTIRLDTVFKRQKKFIKKFFNVDNLSDLEKTKWTKEFVLCIQQELAELIEELPWKHWKDYSDFKIDVLNLQYELVDVFHFFVDLCLIWDIDSKKLLQMYDSKSRHNFDRQKNPKWGYVKQTLK